MAVICFATPAYLDRTASGTSLMAEGSFNRWLSMGGILAQPIDDCLWLVVQSRGGHQRASCHPAARRLLWASRRRRNMGGANLHAHEGACRPDPADHGRFPLEGPGAHLHLRLHCGPRPQPADDLPPHEQAQRGRPGRSREAWDLDLLPARERPEARNAPAAEVADRLACRARHQLLDQLLDPNVDFVADVADRFQVLVFGVLEVPVLIALAGIDRAGVTAAHRDDNVGCADEVIRERLGKLAADVDAELTHCLDHARIERARGFAA